MGAPQAVICRGRLPAMVEENVTDSRGGEVLAE